MDDNGFIGILEGEFGAWCNKDPDKGFYVEASYKNNGKDAFETECFDTQEEAIRSAREMARELARKS